MGATRNTGYLENLIAYDASNNVAIATTAIDNAFKITMGGSVKMTGALSGTSATFGGLLTINVPTDNTIVGIFHAGGGTANRGLKISTFANVNDNAGVRLDAQTTAGGATMVLATAGTDRLTISSTGAATFSSSTMNIGTSTSRGNVTIEQTTGNNGLVVNSAIAESPSLYLRDGGGAGYSTIQANNNLYINASKVGIGTTAPTGKLMLYQSTAGNVFQNIVSNQGGSTQVGINLSPSMTDGELAANPAQASIYATDSNYGANIIFASKNTGAVGNALTERMRITSGGDININMPNATDRSLSWYSANGLYQVAAIKAITDPSYNDAGILKFFTAGTSSSGMAERMRITSDGYVRLASKGIQFNNDTADANSLDDYEEGTWTPTITGSTTAGTCSYTSRTASYTKIGNCVYFRVDIIWTGHTGAGCIFLNGLPYTPVSNYNVSPSVRFDQAIGANKYLGGHLITTQSRVEVQTNTVGGAVPSDCAITVSGDIRATGFYFV